MINMVMDMAMIKRSIAAEIESKVYLITRTMMLTILTNI
jgi:hypothetical protein